MRLALTVLGLAALATPASAQQVVLGNWTRTFFGCDAHRSCHRLTFNMQLLRSDDALLQSGSATAQSWFFTPGLAYSFFITPMAHDPELRPSYDDYRWYYEETYAPLTAYGHFWRPLNVGLSIFYGPLGTPYYDRVDFTSHIYLAVVPEPVSLVLVATGVLGIGAARRRRRGFSRHRHTRSR